MTGAQAILQAAEAFENRLRAMPEQERVEFINELLAWHQVRILDLMPD